MGVSYLVLFLFVAVTSVAISDALRNVLFMPVDDLRPEMLEAYDQKHIHTPNLDKLAKESLVFQRAYCQHALCVPSRNSFMTGKRPDTTQVWAELGNKSFRVTGPNWISLPEHFKNSGYTTLGGGKTYHPNSPPDWDEPKSWSQDQPYFPFVSAKCPKPNGTVADNDNIDGYVSVLATWCPLDEKKYPDSYHYDWQLANHTMSTLQYVKSKGDPWFIAAGFRRPHSPWMMPKKFWDMYSSDDIPTVLHRNRPLGSPDIAFENIGVYNISDGIHYLPMPNPVPVNIQQAVRHAYYASVSWVDSQIGHVLQALDDMSLAENTLVVLFGDHGFQLGEHDSWAKMTNWELAVRVPLIIRAPWKPASAGKRTNAFVELVDLYKTISELVGAPPPGDDIEGVSFAALFDSPDLNMHEAANALNKSAAAYSQYTRCLSSIDVSPQWDHNGCNVDAEERVQFMGYSVRVPNWRYTAWMEWNENKAKWDKIPYAVELYDHHESDAISGTENDFNQCEIENVADRNPDIVKMLHNQLKDFFDK